MLNSHLQQIHAYKINAFLHINLYGRDVFMCRCKNKIVVQFNVVLSIFKIIWYMSFTTIIYRISIKYLLYIYTPPAAAQVVSSVPCVLSRIQPSLSVTLEVVTGHQ